jgi:hypothetical protein
MKIMATHTSATVREQSSHVNETHRTSSNLNALKRRAQTLINDKSIDAQSRAIIRYVLETNDPSLDELVSRIEAGENIADTLDFSERPEYNEDDASRETIEALAEIICGAGDQAAAALLVLMGKLADSTQPEVLAHSAKHFAFSRCGELNLYGMVDADIAIVESKLLGQKV